MNYQKSSVHDWKRNNERDIVYTILFHVVRFRRCTLTMRLHIGDDVIGN